MADALTFLTYIAVILLFGILTSIISSQFRIPNVLLLLLVGIVLGVIIQNGNYTFAFPDPFLTGISIMALVMIVFDSTSGFSLRRFETFYLRALSVSAVFLLLNLGFLTISSVLLFDMPSLLVGLMFAAMMSGTDAAVVLTMLKDANQKFFSFIKMESIVNTPLTVLLPFIILEFQQSVSQSDVLTTIIDQIVPLLQQVVVGIGSGVLIGLVTFKIMRKYYSPVLSSLALITSALLTYSVAENLNGNGVVAVTTLGLLFGYSQVKEKLETKTFSSIFSSALEILVFVLIGLVIKFPLDLEFILKSLLLFVVYLIVRSIAVFTTLNRSEFSLAEKIFMTLNVQKGIAVAVVLFSLVNILPADFGILFDLSLAFMVYSIVLSTVVLGLASQFLHVAVSTSSVGVPKKTASPKSAKSSKK